MVAKCTTSTHHQLPPPQPPTAPAGVGLSKGVMQTANVGSSAATPVPRVPHTQGTTGRHAPAEAAAGCHVPRAAPPPPTTLIQTRCQLSNSEICTTDRFTNHETTPTVMTNHHGRRGRTESRPPVRKVSLANRCLVAWAPYTPLFSPLAQQAPQTKETTFKTAQQLQRHPSIHRHPINSNSAAATCRQAPRPPPTSTARTCCRRVQSPAGEPGAHGAAHACPDNPQGQVRPAAPAAPRCAINSTQHIQQ